MPFLEHNIIDVSVIILLQYSWMLLFLAFLWFVEGIKIRYQEVTAFCHRCQHHLLECCFHQRWNLVQNLLAVSQQS